MGARDKLVASAIDLMRRYGIAGTGIAQLLDHSGISRRSVYLNFPGGKAELVAQNTGLVHPMLAQALKAGLVVHPYTLRAEESFLTQTPTGINQPVVAEAVQLYGLGVQGFFIDQPDLGVAARDIFLDLSRH